MNRFVSPRAVTSQPVVRDGTIYLTTRSGQIIALTQ